MVVGGGGGDSMCWGLYRYVAVLRLDEDSDGSSMMVVLQRGLVIVCDGQRV